MSVYSEIFMEALPGLSATSIEDYAIGINYVAVRTGFGVGLAYCFTDDIARDSRVLMDDYIGWPAEDVGRLYLGGDPLAASVGLAAMNSVLVAGEDDDVSLFDRIDFTGKRVGLIGYFRPIVERIRQQVDELLIFELRSEPGVIPPYLAEERLPDCELVIITGSTFSNRTTADYLYHVDKDAEVVMLGPSTPMSDKMSLFGHMAGVRVADPDGAFDVVKKGGGRRRLDPFITSRWLPMKR